MCWYRNYKDKKERTKSLCSNVSVSKLKQKRTNQKFVKQRFDTKSWDKKQIQTVSSVETKKRVQNVRLII